MFGTTKSTLCVSISDGSRGLSVVLPVRDSTLIGLNPIYDNWHIVSGGLLTVAADLLVETSTTAGDCLKGAHWLRCCVPL